MRKIVVICRVFVSEYMINRWRVMARENSNVDITLLGHTEWASGEFGKFNRYSISDIEEERFHYHQVKFDDGRFGRGIVGLEGWLRVLRPDFVYLIGLEVSKISYQVAHVKKRYLRNMKIALFTMRGLDMPRFSFADMRNARPLKLLPLRWIYRFRWLAIRNSYDAIFCHYPHGRDVIREQGRYEGPIYMQTQVGVNNEWFRPDVQARKRIRAKLGLSVDEYVFGTSCRINYHQKGVGDILAALPLGPKTRFVFIGDGPDMKRAQEEVKERGLENYVIFTGFVSLPEPTPTPGIDHVQDYFNALDCFVLMSRTSVTYIDTYPLVLSQAMATGLPCIVSTSGALPYEVGDIGDVVPEKDSASLRLAMEHRLANKDEGIKQGQRLKDRLQNTFEMRHLNRCFLACVEDILAGVKDQHHFDQTNFTF